MPSSLDPHALAAVDLGSNSFHMLLTTLIEGEPVVVDRLREQVQLSAGLDEHGHLTREARRRALACLDRFGQRLRDAPGVRVRAVGTNTLRVARNAQQFLVAAEAALGHPIEVVSGLEEARLIYLGVAHASADDEGCRLVVDIGGGSTECILGERFETFEVHSLFMGCVRYTREYFRDGTISAAAMTAARHAASRELVSLRRGFRDIGWEEAVGCSGTIKACGSVLAESGWSDGAVTREGLQKLEAALIAAGHTKRLELPGLKAERVPIIAGGLAILLSVFEALDLETMRVTQGSMREGLLYDLLGRIRHEDVRERTIRLFQDRYHVDRAHAARVERTALHLLDQVAEGWELDRVESGTFLSWAARLHEIGLGISYRHHHRHGAYLLIHSEMPGLSREDQMLLAAIVGAHRRKVPAEHFDIVKRKASRRMARRLAVLLRLSNVLNRARSPKATVVPRLTVDGRALRLVLPAAWLRSRSLMRSDLEDETDAVRGLGQRLRIAADDEPE